MSPATTPSGQPELEYGGRERRQWDRYILKYPVLLVAERPGKPAQEVSGVTVNISRGGVLVRVDGPIEPHTHCTVRFRREARGRLKPEVTAGVVRALRQLDDGDHAVAIEFYVPLEGLKRPGEV